MTKPPMDRGCENSKSDRSAKNSTSPFDLGQAFFSDEASDYYFLEMPCSPFFERRKQKGTRPVLSPSPGFVVARASYHQQASEPKVIRHLAAAPNQIAGLLTWPNADRGA